MDVRVQFVMYEYLQAHIEVHVKYSIALEIEMINTE